MNFNEHVRPLEVIRERYSYALADGYALLSIYSDLAPQDSDGRKWIASIALCDRYEPLMKQTISRKTMDSTELNALAAAVAEQMGCSRNEASKFCKDFFSFWQFRITKEQKKESQTELQQINDDDADEHSDDTAAKTHISLLTKILLDVAVATGCFSIIALMFTFLYHVSFSEACIGLFQPIRWAYYSVIQDEEHAQEATEALLEFFSSKDKNESEAVQTSNNNVKKVIMHGFYNEKINSSMTAAEAKQVFEEEYGYSSVTVVFEDENGYDIIINDDLSYYGLPLQSIWFSTYSENQVMDVTYIFDPDLLNDWVEPGYSKLKNAMIERLGMPDFGTVELYERGLDEWLYFENGRHELRHLSDADIRCQADSMLDKLELFKDPMPEWDINLYWANMYLCVGYREGDGFQMWISANNDYVYEDLNWDGIEGDSL